MLRVNSLAPKKSGCDFKNAIFSLVLLIGIFISVYDNAIRWTPWDLTGDKTGSDNGLVPSGNKSLAEQMLTQFYADVSCH